MCSQKLTSGFHFHLYLPSSSRYCTSSSAAIWPSLGSWGSRMRREQQRQNTVSTLNSLSLTEDKPELIHAETGQARGKYVCVCLLCYYDRSLCSQSWCLSQCWWWWRGDGGDAVCLAPLGRDASADLILGVCAVCWGRTFESGVLSTSERNILHGERFGCSPCESAC